MRKQIPLFFLSCSSLCIAAPAPKAPNILFIMPDDLSPNALSCYGNQVIKTPGMDRLASEGMRFENAMTPNSYCTPARAILLTGKYSHKNGTLKLNEPFDGSQQTYPKLLQQAGYQTALFGKWHLLTQPTGFDYYCAMKMQGGHNNARVWETGEEWIPWVNGSDEWNKGGRILPGYSTDAITDEAIKWIKNRNPDKPFCLLLHPKAPHGPYEPAKRYKDFLADVKIPEPATLLDDYAGRTPSAVKDIMFSNRLVIAPRFLEKLTPEQRQDLSTDQKTKFIYQDFIKGYYRLVMAVDDNVTRMLDFLKESGLEGNTIVVLTSDNGFFLGEHGFFDKMWMYEPSIHVPLIIRYPGVVKSNTVNSSLVNHTDIAPTLLALAGLPVPADMQGVSLKPVLEGKEEKVRDTFYYHFYRHTDAIPEIVGVRTERYKLICYPGMDKTVQWELFDLSKDSDEMNNLYSNPEYQDVLNVMETKLRSTVKAYDDPVVLPGL